MLPKLQGGINILLGNKKDANCRSPLFLFYNLTTRNRIVLIPHLSQLVRYIWFGNIKLLNQDGFTFLVSPLRLLWCMVYAGACNVLCF